MTKPDAHILDEIHRRLLDRDPTAPGDLAQLVLKPLAERLHARFPTLGDPSIIDDAVVDAVLSYAERPTQFDPSKRGLFGYLEMSARGDLQNAIKAKQRREQRERSLDVVELPASRRNRVSMSHELSPRTDAQVVSTLTSRHLLAKVRAAAETREDAMVLQLMIEGERRTDRFADVLGLGSLSAEERQRAVKRYKDRMKKRLERLGLRPDE